MTQEEFKRRHAESWQRLECMLEWLHKGPREKLLRAEDVVDVAEFDREYRRVCKHLSLARQRLYGAELIDYLNDLTLEANRHFYGQSRRYLPSVKRFFLQDFPALVRSHAAQVWVSASLFVVPALGIGAALLLEPDLIHSVMDAEEIRRVEEMYAPGSSYRPHEQQANTDVAMFGFYILNNVGIGFRTVAGGVVFGFGSILFVAMNGLFLGAVVTHLQRLGYAGTFFPFVAGHSAPELTAIVLAGAAGLNLGWSLIAPGRRGRGDALREAASDSIRIVYGVAGMLVLAAVIEAFWSPRESIPAAVKIATGGVVWLLTLSYFLLAGRKHES